MAREFSSTESAESNVTSPCTRTPATPGVWHVSHPRFTAEQGHDQRTCEPASSFDVSSPVHAASSACVALRFANPAALTRSAVCDMRCELSFVQLVTDVTFVWSYPASSALVTGTFSNWEKTETMQQISGIDGNTMWVFSKALSPGEYQYKFIIDNVWRHAPDQQITFDERGIINNVLSVTVEFCGDPTCFCNKFFDEHVSSTKASDSNGVPLLGNSLMTPRTMARFQRRIGVAYKYTERDARALAFRKSYMHTEISDRPFDVTVVNVNSIKDRVLPPDRPTEGTISRASSYEHINLEEGSSQLDPDVPIVDDAAYAAVLNDQDGSLPHTAPYRAYAFCGDPTELAYSVRARLSSPMLGFSPTECSDGIRLINTNHCAVRMSERGLYKSVRGALPVRTDCRRVHFEFFVLRQSAGGGVCLGLATRELPLNCLCGTRPNSIGFCTSGSLVRTVQGRETWTAFGTDVGSGSTVGCLCSLNKIHNESDSRRTITRANVEFYVDGASRGTVDYEFVGDIDIFPTLSLFAKNTRVYSLFNGPDMLFSSCLPLGETIVALDGRSISRESGNTPQSLGLAKDEDELSA